MEQNEVLDASKNTIVISLFSCPTGHQIIGISARVGTYLHLRNMSSFGVRGFGTFSAALKSERWSPYLHGTVTFKAKQRLVDFERTPHCNSTALTQGWERSTDTDVLTNAGRADGYWKLFIYTTRALATQDRSLTYTTMGPATDFAL